MYKSLIWPGVLVSRGEPRIKASIIRTVVGVRGEKGKYKSNPVWRVIREVNSACVVYIIELTVQIPLLATLPEFVARTSQKTSKLKWCQAAYLLELFLQSLRRCLHWRDYSDYFLNLQFTSLSCCSITTTTLWCVRCFSHCPLIWASYQACSIAEYKAMWSPIHPQTIKKSC